MMLIHYKTTLKHRLSSIYPPLPQQWCTQYFAVELLWTQRELYWTLLITSKICY